VLGGNQRTRKRHQFRTIACDDSKVSSYT
jgi:hypothetical protein